MRDTKLGLIGVVVLGTAIASVFGLTERAMGEQGVLQVHNNLDGGSAYVQFVRADEIYIGTTDDYDPAFDINNYDIDGADIYSAIPDHNLEMDFRPEDSNLPYDLRLTFNGTPSDPINSLTFNFPYLGIEFGIQEILFQSDLLPFGPVVDVRKAIAQNGGIVELIDLPAGTYSASTPYGSGILTIGTKMLADLDDEGCVNFKDYAHLAEDYGKSQGQYVGDIAGPNGIPDGYVDGHDLREFTDSWLDGCE